MEKSRRGTSSVQRNILKCPSVTGQYSPVRLCLPVNGIWRMFFRIEATMDKNQCEFFAQFTYADSLTYDELLSSEAALMARLEEILPAAGGQHLDFTPLGDMLRCQCAFESVDLENFREIAGHIAALLTGGITGRLLFLDKCLTDMHLFWLQKGAWQEAVWSVPLVAPADAPAYQVDVAGPENLGANGSDAPS